MSGSAGTSPLFGRGAAVHSAAASALPQHAAASWQSPPPTEQLRQQQARRWLERLFLLYTPLWVTACFIVMRSGAFKQWRDPGHMALGLGMALPLWLVPLFAGMERGVPLRQRYTIKATLFIALFSFLQNYFGAPLFFRCFGMEYHFPVTWSGNGSPWFLSFMTVAYFSTYFAIMQTGLRWADARLDRLDRPEQQGLRRGLRAGACLLLGYSMAFAETLTMANEWLRGYFAYADKTRMLVYGSLCYGTLLSIALPLYARLGDEAEPPLPLSQVLWQALGANMLVLICYELFAAVIGRSY